MNFHKIIFPLIFIFFLAACRETDKREFESKKKLLGEYKTQVKDLNVKIEALEKDIAKLDTGFKVEQKSKLVQVEELKKTDFKHYIEIQGSVDAEENVTVLSQQPGIVTAIYVRVGDHVTKGQLLGLTATTAAVEDQLTAAQTQFALASTAYDKQKALWDQKIGSEMQYLQAKTQNEAAGKNVDALKQQLEMTKIIAPIDGTVDQVNLRVGDMAAPSQLMPGIRIINEKSLKVKAKLADSDFGKIKQGDIVKIKFPDINKTITAPVTFVSKTIDTKSRTFNVEVKLTNDNNDYAANMLARLLINDETIKNAIQVPTNVVQKSAEGTYVLIAVDNKGLKTVSKRMVTTGDEYDGNTVIVSGLNEGDKIITVGYTEVVDGERIEY